MVSLVAQARCELCSHLQALTQTASSRPSGTEGELAPPESTRQAGDGGDSPACPAASSRPESAQIHHSLSQLQARILAARPRLGLGWRRLEDTEDITWGNPESEQLRTRRTRLLGHKHKVLGASPTHPRCHDSPPVTLPLGSPSPAHGGQGATLPQTKTRCKATGDVCPAKVGSDVSG